MNWKYTTVLHGARKAMGLSVLEYCILDLIYQSQVHPSFSKEGWTDTSHRQIADFFGVSVGAVHKVCERMNGAEYLEINPGDPRLKRTTPAWFEVAYLDDDTIILDVQKVNVQKVNTKRSKSERKRSKSEQLNKEINSKVNNIVSLLNEKLSTSYKPTSKKTGELIRARLRDGFTEDDFRAVIEHKARAWKNTDLEKYLRPSTLFAVSHFEEYVQEARAARENQVNTDAALNDCELPAELAARYERYIARVIDRYPALFNSRCRVLSKGEFAGWVEHRTMPGLKFQYLENQILARIDTAHAEVNALQRLRENTQTMNEYIFAAFRKPQTA